MSKSKPKMAAKVEQKPLPIGGGKYKRLAVVSGSQIKTHDNVPVYVKIVAPIERQPRLNKDKSPKLDDDGNPSFINVVKVVDLETGEVGSMVAGNVLADRLTTYQGGNERYVGLCFEITKLPKMDGKKWKDYRIHEIEAKGEGKV